MALNAQSIADLVALWQSESAVVAESLNQCFSLKLSLTVSEPESLPSEAPPELSGPGLLVHFQVNGSTILVAVPEKLLPAWYCAPNAGQESRIDSLAMEWSLNCLPAELVAKAYGARPVASLWSAIQECGLEVETKGVKATLTEGEGEGLWFVLPVRNAGEVVTPDAEVGSPTSVAAVPEAPRIVRILKLPVQVIVQLARKKIEMGQLCGLAPGSLVTFDKSCEDLLDLYVNNQLFCRGEAVKVGEKFGLKVNEVGPVEQRVSAVIDRNSRG